LPEPERPSIASTRVAPALAAAASNAAISVRVDGAEDSG
jgi:hypothetical protein